MKRPLAVVGITMLITLFVLCSRQSLLPALFALLATVVCFSVSIFVKKTRQTATLPTVFGSVAVACLLLLVFECFVFIPTEKLNVERGEICATVLEYPYVNEEETRIYFNARITVVDGEKTNVKARLSFPAKPWKRNTPLLPQETLTLEPGDKLLFVGKLYKIAEGSSEIHNYFKSKGICLAAYPLGFVEVDTCKDVSLYNTLLNERKKAINQIVNAFDGDVAGVIISLLMGEKRHLSPSLYENFCNSGVAHLMAVSGLHLSVWIMFIINALKRQKALTKKSIVALMFFVLLIMFFASYSGSVMRAGFMMLLFLFSELFGERSDSLNSLGFSALCLLLVNPYNAVNASFLLSFVSTLVIIVLALPVSDVACGFVNSRIKSKPIKSLLRLFLTGFFISAFVTVETLPFQIEYFGGVSLVGVLTNLLLVPISSPMILCSGIYVMFYFVPVVSDVLFFAANLFVRYCCSIVNALGSMRFSYLNLSEGFVLPTAMLSVVLACVVLHFLKKEKQRRLR